MTKPIHYDLAGNTILRYVVHTNVVFGDYTVTIAVPAGIYTDDYVWVTSGLSGKLLCMSTEEPEYTRQGGLILRDAKFCGELPITSTEALCFKYYLPELLDSISDKGILASMPEL